MAFDFTYDGKQIQSSGPFKPSGKNMPVDARTIVDTYADIASIPLPFVGMNITVRADETNDNKMTDYKVISLKANTLGVANMLINEVQRLADYIGVSSGTSSGSGEGLTTEQAQQLATAYEHSQSTHVQSSDIPTKVSELENDSSFVTTTEMNTAIKNAQLGGGSSADLSSYALRTELPTKLSQLNNDIGYLINVPEEYITETELENALANFSTESGSLDIIDYLPGCTIKLDEVEPVYGQLVVSENSISCNENTDTTFTVKLASAPNVEQTVKISCTDAYVNVSPQSITFKPATYSDAKTITVNILENPNYEDWTADIRVSSLGVIAKIITVNATNITKAPVPITSITLDKTTLTLNEGTSETLTPTILPSDADTGYSWKSSDTAIATVSDGVVQAISDGSAIITCYSNADETIKAECSLTVNAVAIESITLPETATVNRNRSITLTPTIVPESLTSYAWSVDNSNVTVDNGIVSGVTAGTSVVTCYSTRNESINDTTTVTIEELPIESISLDTTASVEENKTITLTPVITPSDATVGYSWSVDNEYATVENGIVTGITAGTSVITCYSNADSSIKAICTITITEKVVKVIDNVAIQDESLYYVFDARDGSNEDRSYTLEDRVDHDTPVATFEIASSDSRMDFNETTGYTENGLRMQYTNRPGVSNPTKATITVEGIGTTGYENTATYKNITASFGFNSIDKLSSNDQYNYQFLKRGSGYGIGLANAADGLYRAKSHVGSEEQYKIAESLDGKTFITFVWDGSNVLIYINAVKVATIPYSETQNNGAFYNIWSLYSSAGDIECFQEFELATLHTRILTDEEILQNYNAYIGGND